MTPTMTDTPLRDAMYAMSLAKAVPDAELLDEFVRRYPEHADALTEFAIELALDGLQHGDDDLDVPADPDAISPVVSRVMSQFQNRLFEISQKRALDSIKAAGLDEAGLPKLAIVRADAERCHLERRQDGWARFSMGQWTRTEQTRRYVEFPAGSFAWPAIPGKVFRWREFEAIVPLIPINLRPKRGLENYHVLWEAEWAPVPPRDPMLLRRIGRGDMWLVVAAWDLTEVERAAMAARIGTA
ncbi:MAG: hypothetical protein Q7S17_06570 [Xanthobacteraceae bacterium]|nr:hypothetical protein [Xanthobacteraceae bacterium]